MQESLKLGNLSYRNCKTKWDGNEENAEEGAHARQEVEFVNFPQPVCSLVVDQSAHSGDDDGCQDNIGGVVEQWHQKQQSHKHS